MSLITWKKEFFDEKLNRKLLAAKGIAKKRELTLQAIDASIKKWGGLTQKSLKKHKLKNMATPDSWDPVIFKDKEGRTLSFQATCHLCSLYNRENVADDFCAQCPLNIIEDDGKCSDPSTAFDQYIERGGTRPSAMIAALKKARKYWVKEYARMFPPVKEAKK